MMIASIRTAFLGTALAIVVLGNSSVALPTLTVSAASRSAVTLSWTAAEAGAKIVVERKQLGAQWPAVNAATATATMPTPSTIAIVITATATDDKIDAYATYVYRVRALTGDKTVAAPSNEVTVGPPPVGFTSLLAAPAAMQAHDASSFASVMKMALDANGDPAIAYLTNDLNNDGELDDTDLSLITWNRARYKWNAPVELDTVGNVSRSGTHAPFSVAFDASTRQFGMFHMIGDREMRLSTSDDGGVTWKHVQVEKATGEEPGFSTPSLAMAGGRIYLAYAVGNNIVRYRSGTLAEGPGKWKASSAPALAGSSELRSECVNIALDGAGKPVVGYCLNGESYNAIAALWHPESGSAVKIFDTNNIQNDDPGMTIATSGNKIAVGFYGARDKHFFENHHIWFTSSSDNGASFGPVVVVADDGGNAMGPPLSATVDRAGHAAMVANVGGGNEGEVRCGSPKLMRSSDGTNWTTCGADTKGMPARSDVSFPVGMFAGNDKLYIVMKTRASTPGIPAGLALWRER